MSQRPFDTAPLDPLAHLAALAPDQRTAALEQEQERRWAAGSRISVESFLQAVPDLESDRELLLDLVHNEYLLRERRGERPAPQEYLDRFPALREPLRRLFRLEDVVKSCAGMDNLASPETKDERQGDERGRDTNSPGQGERPAFPDVGDQLGGYRLVERLGSGGMGTVYRAEDPLLQRQVALKVVKPELAASPESRERFLREARSAARLKHDHIVGIYHVGEDRGVLFLVMELLHGESLQARLKRAPPLTLDEIYQIGRELAAGLAAAHRTGLIHRDVKPANVFLEGSEQAVRVKLLDFGLARPVNEEGVTQPGVILGTVGYMAPEQALGEPTDARSDLFSLGCVLYRLTTNAPAFAGKNTLSILKATVETQPRPPHELRPETPRQLSNVILQLLAKDPAQRPASAEEVIKALTPLENTQSFAAGRQAPILPRARRWLALGWATAFLALVVAAGFVGTIQMQPSNSFVPPSGEGSENPPVTPASRQYHGAVQLDIFRERAGRTTWLRLGEFGAQPLEHGDRFRLTATVTPAAYIYLFLISADGTVQPLYPWTPGDWNSRPIHEAPQDRVQLPPTPGDAWTVTEEKRGMITFLLAARPDRWPANSEEIQALFAGLGEQKLVDRMDLVYFDNGRIVTGDPRRGSSVNFQGQRINHPIFQLQERLREKVQPQVAFTSAVSVATGGKR